MHQPLQIANMLFSCERGWAWLGTIAVSQRLFCLVAAARAAQLRRLQVKPSESNMPAACAVTAAVPSGGPAVTCRVTAQVHPLSIAVM